MSLGDLRPGRGRTRALQRPRCREQLVEVGHLAGIVTPCAADRTAAPDEEGRTLGHVLHPAELVRDPEPARRVPVPVRQELQLVEVERLAPGRLRPGGVARDRVRRDARLLELRSPVTQELELVRSGRGPGEEEEDEERRAARDEVDAAGGIPRSHPNSCVGCGRAGLQHGASLLRRRGAAPGDALRERARERRARLASELLDDVRDGLDLRGRQPQEQPLVRVDPAD